MLTEEQRFENKKRYVELASKLNIDLTKLMAYLEAVDFFNKPNSVQYQRAYDGGLCEYAIAFAHELGALCSAYFPGRYTEQDILTVALFKDIYKAEMYETYLKNVKNEETGKWEAIKAYRVKESRPVYGDLGFSSYMIVKNFINLTDEQIEAITHASGLNTFAADIYDVLRNFPLVALARMADTAVNYII